MLSNMWICAALLTWHLHASSDAEQLYIMWKFTKMQKVLFLQKDEYILSLPIGIPIFRGLSKLQILSTPRAKYNKV